MQQLNEKGLSTALIDMYSLLPFDRDALLEYARCAKVVLTVEEHSPYGGLNALTAQTLAPCSDYPCRMLPSSPAKPPMSTPNIGWIQQESSRRLAVFSGWTNSAVSLCM